MALGGFHGQYLVLDLSSGKSDIVLLSDNIIKDYIGGRGIGTKLLYDAQPAGVDGLSEQNHLIVTTSPVNTVNRKRIIEIVNQRRVPAIFPFRFYVRDGALMAYGFNAADQFRRAATYVDRILKGEKAGNLPVQGPVAFEFGINLSTARAMGLTVPQSLLIAADEIVQ